MSWPILGNTLRLYNVPFDETTPPAPLRRGFLAMVFCGIVVAVAAGVYLGHWAALGISPAADQVQVREISSTAKPEPEATPARKGKGGAKAKGRQGAGTLAGQTRPGAKGTREANGGAGRGSGERVGAGPGAGTGAAGVGRDSGRQEGNSPTASLGVSLGVSAGMMERRLVYAPRPEYPKLARLAHIEGPVVLEAVVSRDGTVGMAHALSGPQMLRDAAQKALLNWRYLPYMVDGRPRDVATIIEMDFRLDRSADGGNK
jgi:TonB family protein